MSWLSPIEDCEEVGHHWHAIPEALSAQCCECGMWLHEVEEGK